MIWVDIMSMMVEYHSCSFTLQVTRGDRVAQLISERIFYPELEEVKSLTETERGTGGYGSTGKN